MVCGPAFIHGGSLLQTPALLILSCSGILHTGFGGLGSGKDFPWPEAICVGHLAVPRPTHVYTTQLPGLCTWERAASSVPRLLASSLHSSKSFPVFEASSSHLHCGII